MATSPSDPADEADDPPPPTITPTDHSRLRSSQGRPIGQVVNDVQKAGPNDVFIQTEDGRYVVRGPNAREHIIESNGEHVTSIRPRTDAAHKARLRDGTIRPATDDEFRRLKDMIP
jgi:hypothetical protein